MMVASVSQIICGTRLHLGYPGDKFSVHEKKSVRSNAAGRGSACGVHSGNPESRFLVRAPHRSLWSALDQ